MASTKCYLQLYYSEALYPLVPTLSANYSKESPARQNSNYSKIPSLRNPFLNLVRKSI